MTRALETGSSRPAPRGGPRSAIPLVLGLALVALAYARALELPFLWDDRALIASASGRLERTPLHEIFARPFFSDGGAQNRLYYRPLATASFVLDERLWGGSPIGFHLTNLLLHLGVCALVYGLARRAGVDRLRAALASTLFGVLPRLTESVGIVTGRTDVLAALGALGCLALHRPGPGAAPWRLLSAGALFLGLLAKEVAAATLGALAFAALEGGRARRRALDLLPATGALAAYGLLRIAWIGAPSPTPGASLADRVLFALHAAGEYVRMFADPLHPRLRIGVLGLHDAGAIALGGAAVAALAIAAVRSLRRPGPAPPRTMAALAVCALLPVLHLIPLRVDVVAADRFAYLPSAALAVLLACALARLSRRTGRAAALLVAVVIALCGAVTSSRLALWTDEIRFWEDAASKAPRGDGLPLLALGSVYARRGDLDRALVYYERSLAAAREIQAVPASLARRREILLAIARNLGALGRRDEAVSVVRELVADESEDARLRLELGQLHAQRLDFDAAEAELLAARALDSELREAADLLRGVRRARSLWREGDSFEVSADPHTLERAAEVYANVRRLEDAARLWHAVASHPEASPEAIRRAAIFLSLRGDPEHAAAVFERYRRAYGESDELRSLEATWQWRKRAAAGLSGG